MSLDRDALRRLAQELPPRTAVPVPREWLLELLDDASLAPSAERSIDDFRKRMKAARPPISQNALAKELGKEPSQVSRWFTVNPSRRVRPDWGTVEQIEHAIHRLEKRRA